MYGAPGLKYPLITHCGNHSVPCHGRLLRDACNLLLLGNPSVDNVARGSAEG